MPDLPSLVTSEVFQPPASLQSPSVSRGRPILTDHYFLASPTRWRSRPALRQRSTSQRRSPVRQRRGNRGRSKKWARWHIRATLAAVLTSAAICGTVDAAVDPGGPRRVADAVPEQQGHRRGIRQMPDQRTRPEPQVSLSLAQGAVVAVGGRHKLGHGRRHAPSPPVPNSAGAVAIAVCCRRRRCLGCCR